MVSTVKGPAIFLAQFVGDAVPFDSWKAICGWAAQFIALGRSQMGLEVGHQRRSERCSLSRCILR